MLRLITGKAGTGKTAALMEEISRAVAEKKGGRLLIVPEQYSHEAERELCLRCSDALSLYGEVFSFTGLARRLMSELGGGAAEYLDAGGRLLCMALALDNVGSRLKMYGAARRRPELQSLLLSAVDELKSSCISTARLTSAAEDCGGVLGDKAQDLALIAEAYDAVVANGRADPSDRLDVLARQIAQSRLDGGSYIYVDGFTDFTRQEEGVLCALLARGVQLTVCLTVDDMDSDSEVFAASRRAAVRLMNFAREHGIECTRQHMTSATGKADALAYYSENMFSYSAECFTGDASAVELWSADSAEQECELAAAKAIELVREEGCRWRDIAVAVRGFDEYSGVLESVFRHYGVPLFISRRSEILRKPLPALISGAYEIINGGWDVDELLSYMGTGLTGLSPQQCDLLGSYIYKWQLRGSAWERQRDWQQHPDGYGCEYDESAVQRLEEINALRRSIAAPLLELRQKSAAADTASAQCAALTDYFSALRLPELLERRSAELTESGREDKAGEYAQLWGIVVSALEQCDAILGDAAMDCESFGRLFTLMLSKYDVGLIPVALDRVWAGDFDRMRRRSIKKLIVLGAADNRLPQPAAEGGVFSEDERRRLRERQVELGGDGDGELWREFTLIYNCLSLPSESLIMSCAGVSPQGEEQRPAFVYNRASALFNIQPRRVDKAALRMNSPAPALTLAANAFRGGGEREQAAEAYFRSREPERCARLAAAAELRRGRLSPAAVEALYGREVKLSASRAEKFSSCKFAYFCQYGLRAKPYEPAGFSPPEIGVFMHYILENTAREIKQSGGFGAVEEKTLRQLTDKYVSLYIHGELNDFQEKSPRFIYLFKRLSADVYQVVWDLTQELKSSDFVPLSFELDFASALSGVEGAAALTGVADRVDGWVHDGRLYLRVVDYKTGKKSFSLSDVWYGMGMQLLFYLFALAEGGEKLYGREIVPAGVMYVPARNALLSLPREPDGDEALRRRQDELRRSGLVLDDPALLEAWEKGTEKKYIPVRYKSGKPSADSLASGARLGLLGSHINKRLAEMASELRGGSVAADPYYRGQQENACLNCDYIAACWFKDGDNGESCRYMPKLSPERVWSLLEEKENE